MHNHISVILSICIYNISLQNTDFGVLHKSSKRFLVSIFHLSRGTPPPCPTPARYFVPRTTTTYFCYNFVVKNEFCQSIFIYNIALQNTDFGVLQKSSKRFLISMFFPSGEGGTPALSYPLATSCLEQGLRPCLLQFTPPPPSTKSWNAELLYGFLTKDQNN